MVTWRWPVFEEAEIGAMSRWAGREASQRWSKVFEGGDLLENLDEIDLAVAVFDKTCQL